MCRRSSEQVEVERPIVVGGWLPPCLQLSTYSLPRAAADTHNEYNVQVSKHKNTRQADMEFVKKFTHPDFQAKNFTPQKRVNCDIFLANQQRKCIKY